MTDVGDDAMHGIPNFLRIDESLTTSGQPSEAQIRSLASSGCEVVVNLALHDDPRYSLPDETGTVASSGMDYVHIPVAFAAPTEGDLREFFGAMDASRGRVVHVHCAANYRVTAFLGLYRLLREGRDEEDAFAPMRAVWKPNDVWSSFLEAMKARHRERPL